MPSVREQLTNIKVTSRLNNVQTRIEGVEINSVHFPSRRQSASPPDKSVIAASVIKKTEHKQFFSRLSKNSNVSFAEYVVSGDPI
jgi:hypothetical protein